MDTFEFTLDDLDESRWEADEVTFCCSCLCVASREDRC